MTPESREELLAAARDMKGLRVAHLNSTATGGGVAEILQSLVPLTDGLGIHTERVVISPPPQFFQVTKRIHNLLQGAEGGLSKAELEIYFQSIENVADDMRRRQLGADVWFVHDPQVLPLARMLPRDLGDTWVWVCHLDLTNPNGNVLETLLPLTKHYDALVFSLESYVPKGLGQTPPVYISPPAIDPFTKKNTPLEPDRALELISAMGVDPARPLVSQVSRFDPWKDPWGVIEAFRLARRDVPGLQLALLGLTQATDDLEALDILASVREFAAEDPDIHLYFDTSNLPAAIDELVNAFQVASAVIVQKSLREGFGLSVTEAMWKGRPVIGGNVGGILTQIQDGVSGYLVDSVEECAAHMVRLIKDPQLRAGMGKAARESVRARFLMPELTRHYLRIAKAHLHRPAGDNGSLNNGLRAEKIVAT
jgi:trehalose synthase